MNHLNHLIEQKKVFFTFMNENYKIYQFSNLFFRDLQYAILSYFEMKEKPLRYSEAEIVSKNFIKHLVENNELTQIDHKSWRINFEVGIKKTSEMEEVEND